MSNVVFDASALLAYLLDEPGSDYLESYLDSMCISAVNFAEVHGIFAKHKIPQRSLDENFIKVIEFDHNDAEYVGSIYPVCMKLGLSLGDRTCLSLGHKLQAKIFTADTIWKKIPKSLKLDIEVVR